MLGQKPYVMQPYEQIQPNVADITTAVHTTNARITATVTVATNDLITGAVTGGTGRPDEFTTAATLTPNGRASTARLWVRQTSANLLAQYGP